MTKVNNLKIYLPEIIGAMLCLFLGFLSGYGMQLGDPNWYLGLNKPSFNPPGWIFGPVWTLLYLMMGAAAGMLWKRRGQNKKLLSLFVIQLILNLCWTQLFFYFQRIDLALLDIAFLWVILGSFVFCARKQKAVFLLTLPYFLWVSFAMILNASLYSLNGFVS